MGTNSPNFFRSAQLPNGSVILLGARQTGKSTLVRAALADVPHLAYDLLDETTYLNLLRDPGRFQREVLARCATGIATVAVDEVQRIPALLNAVHALIESHGVRFVLTGSSARKLRRGGINLLAGRAALRWLHPLTISELQSCPEPGFDLERALRFGALPAVCRATDDAARVDLLAAYATLYLREEIQAESLVRNLGPFARFLDLAALYGGALVNYSAIARDAAVSVKGVQEYYQILEDTLLALRLEPYRKSLRARMVAQPRVYLFDLGVTNAVAGRLTAAFDRDVRGRLFEQWFILEVWRRVSYAFAETRLYFWRTQHGAEVDLLVERHGKLRVAVEIKARAVVHPGDLSGLRAFGEAHPGVPRIVAAEVERAQLVGDIGILPYRDALARIEQILAATEI